MKTFIGTAAWTLPREAQSIFGTEGSHLERYSKLLSGVEINSSFCRDHQASTYTRWAESVPDDFRFSVKLSKVFTHDARLLETGRSLDENLRAIQNLGASLGVILVQMPASLEFKSQSCAKFFKAIRRTYQGPIALEPRHSSWGTAECLDLLQAHRISKVLADPERCPIPKMARPGVERDLRYFRLHGRPLTYKSSYSDEELARLGAVILDPPSPTSETWCIFDNTSYGFATLNAHALQTDLRRTDADHN